MESLETWRTEALKSFPISKSGMQEGEAKRNLIWSILKDSHCQPLLEHFLDLNSCILYVVLKLGKLAIQCFKWCAIQSWNEGVTAIRIRSLKVEGQFCRAAKSAFGCKIKRRVAKSAFGCEMVSFMLRNFAALLHGFEILLSFPIFATDIFEIFCFRYLMSKSPNYPCNPPIIGFLTL